MRRRIAAVLLGLALLAIGGFALPLLSATAQQRTQELVLDRAQDLDRLSLLALAAGAGGAATPTGTTVLRQEASRYTGLYGESLLVLDGAGGALAGTGRWSRAGRLDDLTGSARAVVVDATIGLPVGDVPTVRPWSRGHVLLTRSLGPASGVQGVLVMDASVDAAAHDVTVGWALVLAGASVGVAAAGIAARAASGWLLRPLVALDAAVSEVAAGHEGAQVAHVGGPEELRALTASFNAMSAALARGARAQRRLVADAAHQLRNPLAALRLRFDVLALRLPPALAAEDAQVVAELERLEALLDDVLVMATADVAGHEAAPPETVDVVGAVSARARSWSATAAAHGVTLAPLTAPGPVEVVLPPGHLEQVLDVVVHNAIEHAGRGSTLTWSLDVHQDAVALSASDDGPGLAPGHLALATGRFWRGPSRRSGTGSGLGLAIASALLEADGGRLGLRANHPRGLVVEMHLPRRAPWAA